MQYGCVQQLLCCMAVGHWLIALWEDCWRNCDWLIKAVMVYWMIASTWTTVVIRTGAPDAAWGRGSPKRAWRSSR